DIFISVERVQENSIQFQSGFNNELCRVMIHGILHLCGYKDSMKSEKTVMRLKEDYYLSLLPNFL
ncbi:MAG: rRNA maturation RNase YbeY, partial [Bacteroidales bacterium]